MTKMRRHVNRSGGLTDDQRPRALLEVVDALDIPPPAPDLMGHQSWPVRPFPMPLATPHDARDLSVGGTFQSVDVRHRLEVVQMRAPPTPLSFGIVGPRVGLLPMAACRAAACKAPPGMAAIGSKPARGPTSPKLSGVCGARVWTP